MGGTLAPTELVGIPKVAPTSGGDIKNILVYINYTLHLFSPLGVKGVRWEQGKGHLAQHRWWTPKYLPPEVVGNSKYIP